MCIYRYFINLMITMNWKVIGVIFIVLTVIFAGVLIAVMYTDGATIAHDNKEIKNLSTTEVDSMAMNHWNQIAIENQSLIMKQYASNATLYWIGGPLNGVYHGYSSINTTWGKFFGMWSAVWFYASTNTTNNPVITVHGNYVNVTSNFLQFVLLNNTGVPFYINTTYSLEYENMSPHSTTPHFEIISETFKIIGKGGLKEIE